jgi:hypothetical protein
MNKIRVNYESSTGTVHAGGLYAQHIGITKCSREFSVHPRNDRRWVPTNQEVTCKQCNPPKKLIIRVDKSISAVFIDDDEKARFVTIRARLLSALETWNNHATGKINKERFDQDMNHDIRDILTDLHEYKHLFKTKRWCYDKKRYVELKRPIRHSIDGKVPK